MTTPCLSSEVGSASAKLSRGSGATLASASLKRGGSLTRLEAGPTGPSVQLLVASRKMSLNLGPGLA